LAGGLKVPETVPFMLRVYPAVQVLFFDNYIGWEGIRWWRFCICGLVFWAGLWVRVWLWCELRLDGDFGWFVGLGLIWFCISDFDRERF
jgi:hypothetical protein